MADYTVIGLYNTSSDEFLVAAVIEGEARCVDTDDLASEWQRIAHQVEADSPGEAEQVAADMVAEG